MGKAQILRLVSSASGSGNSSYIDITNTFEECDDACIIRWIDTCTIK